MNGMHGVDVSWMHFPHGKETRHRSSSNPSSPGTPPTNTTTTAAHPLVHSNSHHHLTLSPSSLKSPIESAAVSSSPSSSSHRHPPLPHTTSSPCLTNGTGHTISAAPPTSRRGSWLSSISLKFSSSSGGGGGGGGAENQSNAGGVDIPPVSPGEAATTTLTPPSSPPSSSSSSLLSSSSKQTQGFLISTLRKLSSPSNGAQGRGAHRGGVYGQVGSCERVIMNRNMTRERCKISELDGGKLKKVAFSVDVEVAPADMEAEVRRAEKRRRREVKEKEKELEKLDDVKPIEELKVPAPAPAPPLAAVVISDPPAKKDKKERTKEGKRERKERKRKSTSVSLTAPAENMTPLLDEEEPLTPPEELLESVQLPENADDDEQKTTAAAVRPRSRRSHVRPTTDPLRIYKQCCQLREIEQLEKVNEQLLKSKGATVLQTLDLSCHKFLLADAVALADFLALVPVRKLLMEDCALTDEMVRVVLCGLATVKPPLPGSSKSTETTTTTPTITTTTSETRSKPFRGVVERLSFKNNPKIGRDGWRYISLFIHMSHSLRAIDLSMINLPGPLVVHAPVHHHLHISRGLKQQDRVSDTTGLFARAIGERLVGVGLEELALGECGLNSDQLKTVLGGVIKGGTKILGLEGNVITDDGLALVGRWIKGSDGNGMVTCEGLDLSNNNIQENLDIISASLTDSSPLIALKLSNCALTPASLSCLLPALTVLPNFRLLDLSNNPNLFLAQPDALPLLRRYLPKLTMLKKLQLANTAMTPDHAIALSEILPDIPMLSHFDILDNPLLVPSGNDGSDGTEGSLEEGAALYTALVAAVKVSKTIVRVDIDEPGPSAGNVIRSLARRVLAFCLRNMEAGAVVDWQADTPTTPTPTTTTTTTTTGTTEEGGTTGIGKGGGEMKLKIELNGREIGSEQAEDDDDDDDDEYDEDGVWRAEENYVVGGTGVVKALGVCLGNKPQCQRRFSTNGSNIDTNNNINTAEIQPALHRVDTAVSVGSSFGLEDEVASEKAGEMSKSLLMRARKIKERIQPALKKAAHGEVEEMHHRRLLFLDETLYRVIHRFEEEYPECRISPPPPPHHPHQPTTPLPTIPSSPPPLDPSSSGCGGGGDGSANQIFFSDDEDYPTTTAALSKPLSRRASEVSLASRNLENEEAQMHRFGNYIKVKGILGPGDEGSGDEEEEEEEGRARGSDDERAVRIRKVVEEMGGEEIRRKVLGEGGVERLMERFQEGSAGAGGGGGFCGGGR